MPNSGPVTEIRTALLESPYVEEVLQVQVEGAEGDYSAVGIRVCLTNVPRLDALPPVLASLRSSARNVVGDKVAVFIEPDFTEPNRSEVPTEAIVIRSMD